MKNKIIDFMSGRQARKIIKKEIINEAIDYHMKYPDQDIEINFIKVFAESLASRNKFTDPDKAKYFELAREKWPEVTWIDIAKAVAIAAGKDRIYIEDKVWLLKSNEKNKFSMQFKKRGCQSNLWSKTKGIFESPLSQIKEYYKNGRRVGRVEFVFSTIFVFWSLLISILLLLPPFEKYEYELILLVGLGLLLLISPSIVGRAHDIKMKTVWLVFIFFPIFGLVQYFILLLRAPVAEYATPKIKPTNVIFFAFFLAFVIYNLIFLHVPWSFFQLI
jgi:uncharacterized membrane protein YhaH (DUF805 family)